MHRPWRTRMIWSTGCRILLSLTVRNRTDINGFELMGYVNRGSTESLVWSWMLGVTLCGV